MSRRFGRNQKRRMRIAIAELEAQADKYRNAYSLSDSLLKKTSRDLHDAKEVISDATRILGPYSSALPASQMELSGRKREHINLPIVGNMDLWSFLDETPVSTSVSIDRLRVLLGSVDIDAFARNTHVRVRFGDGTWGYAISDQAVWNTPRDTLVKRISQELANVIAEKIRG